MIADGPTPQLTDKVDRAIRGNTNQVLQRCAALVRRIKLRLQGQTATNFGAQLCGIQDNRCVRVVFTEALCHGCLHILPRWPRRKLSQPQVQETNLSWKVSDTPASDTPKMYASSCCSHPSLILKRVITSSWSSRVTTASLPAPLTFFLPLSSFAAQFWLRIFSFNSIPNAFQRASHWTTDNPEMNQHQRLRLQAASSPWYHAHVQLQRQDDRSQPSEGRGGGSVKTNGLEKKLKLETDDSEQQTRPVVFRDLCSVSACAFLHAIGPSNRMTTQSLPPCQPRQK